mgnify:CR=1 FL=1
MTSTAYDIAMLLQSEGVGSFGSSSGWSIAVGSEPMSPHTTITLYDTGGLEPDTEQLDRRPSFQVRVRGGDYLAARAKIEEAIGVLQGRTGVVLGGTRYLSFELQSDVVCLGKDDSERFIFVANFRVPLAEAAT